MKTRQAMNEMTTQKNPNDINMILLKRLRPVILLRSNIINPSPPNTNRKLDTNPSIIYCPLTRYYIIIKKIDIITIISIIRLLVHTCMKATGFEWPNSSVVDPIEGGSTITSYIIPPVTRKYDTNTIPNICIDEGARRNVGFFSLRLGTSKTWKGMLYKDSIIVVDKDKIWACLFTTTPTFPHECMCKEFLQNVFCISV